MKVTVNFCPNKFFSVKNIRKSPQKTKTFNSGPHLRLVGADSVVYPFPSAEIVLKQYHPHVSKHAVRIYKQLTDQAVEINKQATFALGAEDQLDVRVLPFEILDGAKYNQAAQLISAVEQKREIFQVRPILVCQQYCSGIMGLVLDPSHQVALEPTVRTIWKNLLGGDAQHIPEDEFVHSNYMIDGATIVFTDLMAHVFRLNDAQLRDS